MTATRSWRHVGLPFVVLRLAGQAAEFAGFVVLARHLRPSEFGPLSVGFLVARYCGLIGDWGASVRGPRDVARRSDPAVLLALIRRRRFVSGALAAAFVSGAVLLHHEELAPLAATILGRGLNRDWLALGRERGLASGGAAVVQGSSLVAMALLTSTAGEASFAIAAASLLGLAFSLLSNRPPAVPLGTDDAGSRPGVDGWMMAAVLADQVTTSADTLLLGLLRSASVAGVYAAIYRIPNAWMTVIGLAVLGLIPLVTRAVNASDDSIGRMRTRALAWGGGLALVVVASAAPTYLLIETVFGADYLPGRRPLLVLLLATALMAFGACLHPLFIAVSTDRDVFTLSLSGAATNLLANLIAIPIWGMAGAAWTMVGTQSLLVAIVLHRTKQAVR